VTVQEADRLAERVLAGDRAALAKAITAVENGSPAGDHLVAAVSEHRTGRAVVVGVTGPPGAGKSTLVGCLIREILGRNQRAGVLLVDPSSPISGGAVLADRVRLPGETRGGDVYVRSLGSRGHAGALSGATRSLSRLLEAWGADVILVETVGAGQSEVDIRSVADVTLVVCPPGLGDEIQAMKAGLMEIADVFVVNKADRPGAAETAMSLSATGPGGAHHEQRPVLQTVATTGAGLPELMEELDRQAARAPRSERSTGPDVSIASTLFDLRGRVAIVTGASSGLGERFAEVLHEAGASVVLAGRRADRLDRLHARLPRSTTCACDVTDAGERAMLVSAALDRFGSLDILVHNAGRSGPPVRAEDEPLERWDATLDVNLSALFGLTQIAARHMLERGRGSIVNITSVFGLVANAPVADAAYAASKGAVVNLTRELAAEWAARGVRVNAIAPGWFPSEMTAGMIDDERSQRYIARGCPMQRMGRPCELDGALLYLASDASSYCTGQTLAVDGGWTTW
jgi:LAO/AO transport system ATPase